MRSIFLVSTKLYNLFFLQKVYLSGKFDFSLLCYLKYLGVKSLSK